MGHQIANSHHYATGIILESKKFRGQYAAIQKFYIDLATP
jgi:hypothetical protein